MADRSKLGKKARFDLFKRDDFTCQYCGQKPPAVVLEIDHVIAVANGGSSEEHNLITACFDCNRGKGAGTLQCVPIDLARKAEMIEERASQVRAYEAVLRKQRRTKERQIEDVCDTFVLITKGWTLSDDGRRSVGYFLDKLPPSEVDEAMRLACSRKEPRQAFKYFCGICWKKIKGERP
jgi:hypothetical protein